MSFSKNVIPEGDEGRRAGIYDADAFNLADLFKELIEALIVNGTAPEDIDVFSTQAWYCANVALTGSVSKQ